MSPIIINLTIVDATINLGHLKSMPAGIKVLDGIKLGENMRNESQIDVTAQKLKSNEKITIVIPKEIEWVSRDFLKGFLENVIVKFGKDGFDDKVDFVNEGEYKIRNVLTGTINSIL